MGEPVTLTTLLTLAGTAVGTVSSIQQGRLAKRRAAEAAKQRELETLRQLAQQRRENAERQARNRALRAAYGGDRAGRSAFAVEVENRRRDAENLLSISISGRSAARGIRMQGREDATRAYGSALQTAFAGGKSLIKKD